MQTIIVSIMVLQARIGWYHYRKSNGHPISAVRAIFGRMPRFGAYEYDEPGCPAWDKCYYEDCAMAEAIKYS